MVTDVKSPEGTSPLVEVRATINLSGLRAGHIALVDPSQPYIAALLQTGRLMRLDSSTGASQ